MRYHLFLHALLVVGGLLAPGNAAAEHKWRLGHLRHAHHHYGPVRAAFHVNYRPYFVGGRYFSVTHGIPYYQQTYTSYGPSCITYQPTWTGIPFGFTPYFKGYFATGSILFSPIYQPAEAAYGPLAMERFLGNWRHFDLPNKPQPLIVRAPAAGKAELPPANAQPRKGLVRESNAEAKRRSQRFLEFGDRLFGEQRFHDALQRYKLAAEAAPDNAEAFFRQAHALAATNRYALAAKAYQRGLGIRADIQRRGFQLKDLYKDNLMAKEAHLEALAQAAIDQPNDADILFLLGLFLYYDGSSDRAERFFRRSAALGNAVDNPARRFLEPEQPNEPAGLVQYSAETEI